ncbi:hypothetical protein LJC37_05840 [Bacteroidales bacterium OttesenSCG-928-E04]|nr:hypothetical protein [Bacteroidales bacterium OttesenSCG-928-E04]
MNDEKIFKTKTGFCHILPDKIVLTRDGVIGNVAKVTVENTILRILLIYGGLSIIFFYFAFDNYKYGGHTSLTVLYGVVEFFLIYGMISSINNSATPIINRDKIKTVKFKKSIMGLTRSRFEVFFEDENGKIKKRLIMLPGSLTNGKSETEKALQIMRGEKIITNASC